MDFIEKLKEIKDKYEEINAELSNPEVVSDQKKLIELSKKRSELEEIVKTYDEYETVLKNINGNKEKWIF